MTRNWTELPASKSTGRQMLDAPDRFAWIAVGVACAGGTLIPERRGSKAIDCGIEMSQTGGKHLVFSPSVTLDADLRPKSVHLAVLLM